MAKPEEHYQLALNMANEVGAALQKRQSEGGEVASIEALQLAQLHVELGMLAVEIERPGRRLIIPN